MAASEAELTFLAEAMLGKINNDLRLAIRQEIEPEVNAMIDDKVDQVIASLSTSAYTEHYLNRMGAGLTLVIENKRSKAQ